MKICSDICSGSLPLTRGEQFSESEREENCSFLRKDNVETNIMSRQMSERILAPNGGYRVYYPSNLIRKT